jgi:DNA gyrase subunit A
VKTINVTEKTGKLIAMVNVSDDDELMIINKSGITIRMSLSALRNMGRATQGVKLISLRNGDKIAAVAKIQEKSEDETIVKPDELSENLDKPDNETDE